MSGQLRRVDVNGKIIGFPIGMSDEEVTAAILKIQEGQQQTSQPAVEDTAQQMLGGGPMAALDDASRRSLELRPREMVEDPAGAAAVFGENLARGAIDIAGATPKALMHDIPLSATAFAGAGFEGIKNSLTGEPNDLLSQYEDRKASFSDKFPFNVTKHTPTFNSIDLQATGGVALELLSRSMRPIQEDDVYSEGDFIPSTPIDYARERDTIAAGVFDRRQQQPFAAGMGDATSVGAALVTGRAPIARNRRLERITRPDPVKAESTHDFMQFVRDVKNSRPSRGLSKGGVHVFEAGLEGAMISATQDRDPIVGFGLGAGTQAVNSGILSLTTTKPGVGLSAAAAGAISLFQMMKEATPGGKNYILETTEDVFAKMTAALALGAAATMFGGNRWKGKQMNNLPVVFDGLTSVSRGATQQLMNDWLNDPKPIEAATRALQTPDFFSPSEMARLNRALEGKGNLSFKETIESLSESDRAFRRKMNELMLQGE